MNPFRKLEKPGVKGYPRNTPTIVILRPYTNVGTRNGTRDSVEEMRCPPLIVVSDQRTDVRVGLVGLGSTFGRLGRRVSWWTETPVGAKEVSPSERHRP